jgi:hypothetical protein
MSVLWLVATSGLCKITFRTIICLSALTRTHGLPSRPYLISTGLLSLKPGVEEERGFAQLWLTPVKKPSTHMWEGIGVGVRTSTLILFFYIVSDATGVGIGLGSESGQGLNLHLNFISL